MHPLDIVHIYWHAIWDSASECREPTRHRPEWSVCLCMQGSGIHTVVFSRRSSSKRSYSDMHTLFQVIIPIGYEYGTEVRYTGVVEGSVDLSLLAHYVNFSTVLKYRIFQI